MPPAIPMPAAIGSYASVDAVAVSLVNREPIRNPLYRLMASHRKRIVFLAVAVAPLVTRAIASLCSIA